MVLVPLAAPFLSGLGVFGATLIWPDGGRTGAAVQVLVLGMAYLLVTTASLWQWVLTAPEKQMISRKLFRRGRFSRKPDSPGKP